MVARWPKGVVGRAVAPLLIACAALAGTVPHAHAAPAALVLERVGVVWLKPADAAQRVLLVLDPLPEHARIEVAKDARAVLYFAKSGQAYTLHEQSSIEVGADAPVALTGPPPTLQASDAVKAVRLRADGIVLGGVVMRHAPGPVAMPRPACKPSVSPEEISSREPDPAAPSSARVLFALWLDDVCAREDANRAWRALARELPFDDAIRQRIR